MISNQQRDDYKKQGVALIQLDEHPVHSYPYDAPWITDKAFSRLYETMRDNTLLDRTRCYGLYLLAQQVKDIPGDVLEVGTWRGGTAAILTTVLKNKTVYLADTFTGVVKSSEWEHYSDKAHDDTSRQLVEDFLTKNIGATNFGVLEGIFPDDTGEALTAKQLALVYLDLDVYLSTKDAFEFVWERVSPGGIVVFDDYGMISACEGISRFVNEIKDDADKLFVWNLNGQAYIVKKDV